jgi:penicillin-binding protein activator
MKKIVLLMVVCCIFFSCTTEREVTRIDETSTYDLSGRWNDVDSRLVSEEMIEDSMTGFWLRDYVSDTGKVPIIIVGLIRNKTTEHISTDIFIKDIERAFINSGEVRVVQAGAAREELRRERMNQQSDLAIETTMRWGRELGANFILQGVLNSITDQIDNKKVVFYQVDLEISNIETGEKVWIGTKKIKKFIKN